MTLFEVIIDIIQSAAILAVAVAIVYVIKIIRRDKRE